MWAVAEPASDLALVVVAAIAAIPSTIGAVAALVSAKRAKAARLEATAANAAVNNRRQDEPSIYDLAREAAVNSRDAVRRCTYLESGQQDLARELRRVASVADRAEAAADTSHEILTRIAREHEQLIAEHRRRWAIDDFARDGTIDRRRRRWWQRR
jgi:MoxR-like ATPase